MMGFYVKGMKMPKNCDDCFFIGRGYPDWCSLPQIPNGEDEIDDTKKRPDWCPLVEIPEPHGDQIDREDTIEPERKMGKWVGCDDDWLKTMCKCSECGAMIDINEKYRNFYCYHCGARMDGELV